jgi:hypothetical protein
MEGHQTKVKKIEERREMGAHQRWRILPEMLAVAAETGDELRWLKGVFAREKKRRWGRGVRASYRCGTRKKWLGIYGN